MSAGEMLGGRGAGKERMPKISLVDGELSARLFGVDERILTLENGVPEDVITLLAEG